MSQKKKCTIKIIFKITNRIQDDNVSHKGKFFGGKGRKLLFLIIFLTYILIGLLEFQV
jgi:hypothetical protein